MKKWQIWLGVLISVVFIWLALRGLQLNQFWNVVQNCKLLVVDPRHRGLFCRGVGAGVAMALSARTDQKNSDENHVPDHDHWIYGQ